MPEDTIQSRFPVCSFAVRGETARFPVAGDKLSAGNRIVEHLRPYREGAKCDDTGASPRRWVMEAVFNNTIAEDGIDPNIPLYPDLMQRVYDLFAVHETGDLFHPIDGKVRARAQSYERVTDVTEVDTGRVTLCFVEDNEDDVDAQAFSRPAVNGAVTALAGQLAATAKQEDVWIKDLATVDPSALEGGRDGLSLGEFCAEIEGLMRAPGERTAAIQAQVRAARRSLASVLRTAREVVGDTPTKTILATERLLDVTAYAASEKIDQLPRRIPYFVRAQTTIFSIAADLKQPPDALMEINEQRIDDPFHVEPGIIRVFERWP